MKKLIMFLMILAMLFAFAACESEEAEKQSSETPSEKVTEPEVVPGETEPVKNEPEQTEPVVTEATEPEATEYPVPPEETEPAETEPEATENFPYTEYVSDENQPVYSGPGYDYDQVGTVGMAAQYTIVEEKEDSAGNIWGKLKSGAGWINLTNVRYGDGHREENPPLLVAYFVDDTVRGDLFFLRDESEYAVRVAFTAGADLYYRFYEGDITEFLQPGEFLTMGHLEKDQTLVTQISFPGDFTTYLMEVETGKDIIVWYQISISGEDGSLFYRVLE